MNFASRTILHRAALLLIVDVDTANTDTTLWWWNWFILISKCERVRRTSLTLFSRCEHSIYTDPTVWWWNWFKFISKCEQGRWTSLTRLSSRVEHSHWKYFWWKEGVVCFYLGMNRIEIRLSSLDVNTASTDTAVW